VDKPPKLDVEPVTPLPVVVEKDGARRPGGPPIHPLSAVLLLVVDNLWNLADWSVLGWILTMPLSFVSVLVPAFFIQRHLKEDTVGRAVAISLFLAVLAAVPTSIIGTPAGLVVLAWAGMSRLLGKSIPRQIQ
jgi:hypothetical protein